MALWFDTKGKSYAGDHSGSWLKAYVEQELDHVSSKAESYLDSEKSEREAADAELQSVFDAHVIKSNPHGITKEQIGLDNVDNTADLDKPISDATQTALEEEQAARESADEQLQSAIAVKPGKKQPNGGEAFNDHAYTSAIGNYSHAEGEATTAEGVASHSEGSNSYAVGDYSHAEGNETYANGEGSHSEGQMSTASGKNSHAEGNGAIASGDGSHAEGSSSKAIGIRSHAEGSGTTAEGSFSHTEGQGSKANGNYSHAEGYKTTASGDYSHAGGMWTVANKFQFVTGKYNAEKSVDDNAAQTDGTLFIVGNGTSASDRSNAFRVDANGAVYGVGAYNTTGADYAEYFEWTDGNTEGEDRRGLFVTLDGEKLRLANAGDDYVLGVISANPSVVGDAQEDYWRGKYLTDVFGVPLTETVTVPESVEEITEPRLLKDGTETEEVVSQTVIPQHDEKRYVINPAYNPDEEYISRDERPEWAVVGMMGKLTVVDDGSCEVNGYCRPTEGGIATKAKKGYRVMKRVDDTHIKILFR